MRTHKIDNTTIEYPDEIAFCFNPMVVNVLGHPWAWIEAVVRDVATGIEHSEKGRCFKVHASSTYPFILNRTLIQFNLEG